MIAFLIAENNWIKVQILSVTQKKNYLLYNI